MLIYIWNFRRKRTFQINTRNIRIYSLANPLHVLTYHWIFEQEERLGSGEQQSEYKYPTKRRIGTAVL